MNKILKFLNRKRILLVYVIFNVFECIQSKARYHPNYISAQKNQFLIGAIIKMLKEFSKNYSTVWQHCNVKSKFLECNLDVADVLIMDQY